ncbi:MAG: hypothetical protein J6R68_03250 [Clostridia bacterium]|nr:hypothetical protein [Clostridia bacterium]
MFKENAKCEKSAFGPAVLWIVFMYVFYIVWGIGEILLGIKLPFIIKHLVMWALTGYFVWKLIFKFMIEFEFAARKNEFTAMRKLGKKSQVVCSVKYENIEVLLTDETKDKLKNYKISKKYDAIRAFQTGKTIYMVYRFDGKLNLFKMKVSDQMHENISLKKEEIK